MMNPSLSSLRKIMREVVVSLDRHQSKNEAVVATPRVKYE